MITVGTPPTAARKPDDDLDSTPLQIVVVEDDRLDAELFCGMLEQAWPDDARITVHTELAAAEAALISLEPDVVFCDLSLPDADGLEVVDRMVRSAGAAPVVIMTNNDDPAIPVLALRMGAQDYLSKGTMAADTVARSLRYAMARSFADGEMRRVASELRKVNEELDQYAGIVAHDLRAPIRTARIFADRLHQNLEASDRPEPTTKILIETLDRADALIDRLLRMARLRDGELELQQEQLTQIVDDVRTDLIADLQSTDGRVTCGDDQTLSVDPILFRELISNLVQNSLKYRHPGRPPSVLISALETEEAVEVLVADNGIGIATEHRERVFGLFERLAGDGDVPGLGFGLAFCQRVATLHGGSIAVVDRGDGPGTCMRISIPLQRVVEDVASRRTSEDAEHDD